MRKIQKRGNKPMDNKQIRVVMRDNNIYMWQVAKKLNVNETSFCKPNRIYVYDLLKADNDNWLPKQFKHRKGRTNEKEIL